MKLFFKNFCRPALAFLFLPFIAAVAQAQLNPLNIGTLPPGKSITVTYEVTVNNPFPAEVSSVSSRAEISGTNFSPLLSDDPATPAPGDATVTPVIINRPPEIADQNFNVDENSPAGTTIAIIAAADPDLDQLQYSIISGNNSNVFTLNTLTGELFVSDSSAFNHEVNNSFTLTVQVQDNGIGNLSSSAQVIVNIKDLNEAPVVSEISKSTDENVPLNFSPEDFILSFSDEDGDDLSKIKFLNLPSSGILTLGGLEISVNQEILINNTADLAYLPDYEFLGDDTFNWSGSDGEFFSLAGAPVIIHVGIPHNRPPVFTNSLPDIMIEENDEVSFTFTGRDPDNDPYAFSIVSFLPAPLNLPQLTGDGIFSWHPARGEAGNIFTLIAQITDGVLSSSDTSRISVKGYNLSGTVSYFGTESKIPGADVTFNLLNDSFSKTTSTDNNGTFSTLLGLGTYSLTISKPDLTFWTSPQISIADAFLAAQHGGGQISLSGLPLLAGNVNNSVNGIVNATDALLIAYRSISDPRGIFQVPAWLFQSFNGIIVNDQLLSPLNAAGILAGDINANAMSGLSKQASKLAMNYIEENLDATENNSFVIPVRVKQDVNPGAFKIDFEFPSDKVRIDSVRTFSGNIFSRVDNSFVSIGWIDISGGTSPVSLHTDEPLLEFFFTAINKINENEEFKINPVGNSFEFVDSRGTVVPGINLESVVFKSVLVREFSLAQNYPNPFNPSTVLTYSIGNNAFVNLKVYDILGSEIAMLVNEEKSPGEYKIQFDGSSLSSGVYFYKIQAGNFVDIKKLILMK